MEEKNKSIDNVNLEEMDWQNAKKSVTEQIRSDKLSLDLNEQILEHCNLRLNQLWDLLPEEEKKKRRITSSMGKSQMPDLPKKN